MYVCMYGGGKGVFLQKFKNHADGLWDGGTLVPRPRYRGQKTACAFSFLLPPLTQVVRLCNKKLG